MTFPTPVPSTPTTPGTTGGWGTEVNAYLSFLKTLATGRMRWAGPWTASATYNHDDVVSYQGGLYIANTSFTESTTFTAANWTTLIGSDPPQLGIAHTIDPSMASASGGVGSANRGYFMRVKGSATCSAVRLHVSTSSGNIRVSVFSNTGTGKAAKPDLQRISSGTVACPATGTQSVSLGGSITINHGDWLMLAADNTTAQFARGSVIVAAPDGFCYGMSGGMTAPGGSVSGSVFSGLNAFYMASDV